MFVISFCTKWENMLSGTCRALAGCNQEDLSAFLGSELRWKAEYEGLLWERRSKKQRCRDMDRPEILVGWFFEQFL